MILTMLSGGIVGIALGLTGGGGSIFAVPLLLYAIGLPLREAVTVSLGVVATSTTINHSGRSWEVGSSKNSAANATKVITFPRASPGYVMLYFLSSLTQTACIREMAINLPTTGLSSPPAYK
jgi:uncharacterized membrane protein YfcA